MDVVLRKSYGPSDAMHNTFPGHSGFSRKPVSFVTEIHTLSIDISTPEDYVPVMRTSKHGESNTSVLEDPTLCVEPCQGLDDGVAASFQRSRIHKPHAHTQFQSQSFTSRYVDSNPSPISKSLKVK
ncbi:hypothetical protein Tco_0844934 [Tanacetum coccineum]